MGSYAEIDKPIERVLIERFDDEYTVMGARKAIRPLDEVADLLFLSDFMRPRLIEYIKNQMRSGEIFKCAGSKVDCKQSYRLLKDEDVEHLRSEGKLGEAIARPEDRARQSREDKFRYRIPGSNDGRDKEIEAWPGKMNKAKKMIQLLRSHVGPAGGTVTVSEVEALVAKNKAALGLKENRNPLHAFKHHLINTYLEHGFVVDLSQSNEDLKKLVVPREDDEDAAREETDQERDEE